MSSLICQPFAAENTEMRGETAEAAWGVRSSRLSRPTQDGKTRLG